MDQTEPENKILYGYQQKCCAYAGLGGYVLLPVAQLYQASDEIQQLASTSQSCYTRNAL